MKKLLFTLLGVIAFLTAVVSVVSAHDDQKVTLCHSNNGNGYNLITADENGNVDGHDNHNDDIIPPFDYGCGNGHQNNTCHYNGKNWDATHQAIWQNGCKVVAITVTATPTPTTIPTPTVNPTGTATPTPTPALSCTPTPTITDTPTPTPSCTPTPADPTATPTPNNSNNGSNNNNSSNNSSSNNSGSSNNNNSTPQQAVLAASTMADTGSFQDTTMNLTLLGGMLSLGLGFLSYGKEKKA